MQVLATQSCRGRGWYRFGVTILLWQELLQVWVNVSLLGRGVTSADGLFRGNVCCLFGLTVLLREELVQVLAVWQAVLMGCWGHMAV